MEGYRFPCKPQANPKSIIQGEKYRFTILNDIVLRYEWSEDGQFEDRASTFTINRDFPKPDFSVIEKENQLDIIAPTYHLTYDKKRFSPSGLFVAFSSKQLKWGSEWRYGDVPDRFNLGGTARTLDGIDGRIDMGTGIVSRSGFAEVDDSGSMLFDGNGFVTPRRKGDRIDGYLFSYDLDFKGAIRALYEISGHQPAVPRWCLGNWWSRYHAYSQDEYLALMDKFKDVNIPLSVAVVDMDWHWVSEDFVPHAGWTGYTWNKDLFPNHVAFAEALHKRNLKITLNDHPRDGVHSHEESYEEMARVLGHDPANKTPILFDPTSPKFMHAFFNVLHRKLEKDGCDFWWIDWQQGSYSRIPGFDPLWLLNHFHYIDQTHVKDASEALIFSRYAGPGSHRYPVGFSGDTVTSWESLKFQPEFTATASNIGYGWWSHDIGGHLLGYRNDELNVRWVQSGVFSPLMRLHSTQSRWMSKEPWLYKNESFEAITEIMRFRHRLVPYIYSESLRGPTPTLPLVQPLYWNYPEQRVAYQFPNEFYFGQNLVAAPITSPRNALTALAKVRMWVPPGRHIDIFTSTVYDGAQEIDVYRPLDGVPVLAKEGSIVPLDAAVNPQNGCPNPDVIDLLVVVGADGRYDLVEDTRDDGDAQGSQKSEQRTVSITFDQKEGILTLPASKKKWSIRFINMETHDVEAPGKDKSSGSVRPYEDFTLNLDDEPSRGAVIKVGKNPQLRVRDHTTKIKDLLLQFQIEFATKDKIWTVVEANQPVGTKVARLISLGLDSEVIGPVLELLTADSRT